MTQSCFPPFANVSCHLFFDFHHEPGPAPTVFPTLRDLATIPPEGTPGAPVVRLIDPARLAADHPRPIGDQPVWETRALRLSDDLHPFVKTMLDCPDPPDNAAPAAEPLIRCRGLSPHGKNLINGQYHRSPPTGTNAKATKGLEVVLSATAKARLAAACPGPNPPDALPIAIEDLQLFSFRTGVTLVVMELSFPRIPAPWDRAPERVLEILPLLSRHTGVGPLRWRDPPTDAGPEERFLPGDLARGVLGQAVKAGEDPSRVYSHVAAVFETPMPQSQARELACRLSRRYTAAYQMGATPDGTLVLEPFEDLIHAASLEGGTSVTNGYAAAEGSERELLKNWLADRYRRVYLPLQIVAVHERAALLAMARNAAIEIEPLGSSAAKAAELRKLCHHFLGFRLRYRHTQVSDITMHNQIHQATRQVLGLDRMIEKIAHDVVEVERWLSDMAREEAAARERERVEEEKNKREEAAAKERAWERRYAWFAGLGGGGLTFLTVTAAAKAIADFLDKSEGLSPSKLDEPTVLVLGVGLVLAFGLAAVGFWYGWRRQGQGHHELSHHAEHAGQKARIKGND